MEINHDLLINNVILKKGTSEYYTHDILNNKELFDFVRKTISFKIHAWHSDFIQKINSENATLVITTDENFSYSEFSLLNATDVLNKDFLNVFETKDSK
ncbi:hypothetical protein LRR18_16720 [Mangrovimonas sp. AS39]|uniref:hypothetical protein n=2 Tax=Mangrovimonas futianensis TaxID=2895523 RepID=UPI001E4CCF35|nr:hypothetical protein [Mangrovimonas futianensis]MCF1193235.1 hypothetical protein [Mangrovimonas futianensis]MCF1196847.1 hypothetical protein [Mangrovimonas futianensis]